MAHQPVAKRSEELPPFPEALRHIWDWYLELSDTRGFSTVAGPITHSEITAFSEGELIHITAWERRLIRKIDRIAREVWGAAASKADSGAPSSDGQIPINNDAAVDLMIRRMLARQRVAERKAAAAAAAEQEGGRDG